MNIICFGDSITQAGGFAEGDRWPTALQSRLGAHKVYNRGIGGHTTAQGLDRFEGDVLPLLPGLLLVEFGFNDSHVKPWTSLSRVSLGEFSRNLAEFGRPARARGGDVVYIVNHMFAGDWDTPTETPYSEAIRAVARELSAPTIDLPVLLRQRGVPASDFLSADGCHLTAQGNHIYAELVGDALLPILTGDIL